MKPARFARSASIALVLAFAAGMARAQEEVLTQENEVGAASWLPAITQLYVATDTTIPVLDPEKVPEFPVEDPQDAKAPEQGDAAALKSWPPVVTRVGGGPPVRDWKAYLRQIESDRNVSFLASTLQAGKLALWVHDIGKAGYLLGYDVDNRLMVYFKVDMLQGKFPSPTIPTGPERRRFIHENIKVVLGSLKVERLDGVTRQGAEGHPVELVYENDMAATTLAELEDLGVKSVEFVARQPSKANGDLLDGVYRVSLEMELEAWGALGFDEPSKRTVSAQIRFLIRDSAVSIDKIGDESQGGSGKEGKSDPAAGGNAAGGGSPN